MPMELLQELANAGMPVEIMDQEVQGKLRVLHDAGHILCSFPPTGSGNAPACVHMVTSRGLTAFRHFGPGSPRARENAAGYSLKSTSE